MFLPYLFLIYIFSRRGIGEHKLFSVYYFWHFNMSPFMNLFFDIKNNCKINQSISE